MARPKKFINNSDLPDHEIEAIARCFYPDILGFYQSEEGQREFAEWQRKKQQAAKDKAGQKQKEEQ